MKKITMQEIADALNISRVTVWKVFNSYPGVSDSLREQVLSKAQELGYFKMKPQLSHNIMDIKSDDNTPVKTEMTVSVVVSRPESSMFWMNIIHQIAKELVNSNINLMYTYLPSKTTDGYSLPSVLTNGTLQGIIVLNVYDHDLLNMLNELKIQKVFLDMVTSIPEDILSGDLFLFEGKSSVGKITEAIIKKGRTEIGFIGDIGYAKTNYDRYEGYLTAMNHYKIPIKKEYSLVHSIGIYTYAEEINEFLSNLKPMPKAFICASDYVAHFVIKYLSANNYRVPEDVAVSGYDGTTEYIDQADYLTTVQVQTRELGKRLVKQLLYRISNPEFPLEVTYIHNKIRYGESTNF
ncbi:substrate-binding domain-containing protein [Anaerocolumna sedimenticola]|uniref:Substrate-binding domain-containing protein n=1 Tax=Anaerocolumna sedimenticola TaxID=2696063 RepID=A0A6P1TPI6_9FIRM|nr:LacI family DNA-binding transcriptional regulator [Anaerocolumna sedimenticola]QHQ61801.1 substrate-binding domain-containing protein [Anaerocolumna sedimenticola]